MTDLGRLAGAVLQPGFTGSTPPDWVRRWLGEGLGGVALFARNIVGLEQVAALTAALRAERPDVLVAIDEEAGDVTRLHARTGSPRPGNAALGAVDDPALTAQVAADLGRELAAAGVTLNYAPVADVNVDPANPVIGVRSFGASPELVARHTAAWVRGLQSAGVAACAKHFPGHGNTSVDSHLDVPRIGGTAADLAAVELPPFRAAVAAGAQALMTGHLLVPAVDPDRPATLSRPVLTELIRDQLGFSGVVITDAIEMRAVSERYGIAGAAVLALAAGADAICVGGEHADEHTAGELREAIVAAVRSGTLPEERLVEAAKRVGQLAEWAVQARPAPVPPLKVPAGLQAARRAVRVTRGRGAPALPLRRPPHVVELASPANIAVGPDTPWGLAQPLAERIKGITWVRHAAADLADPARRCADAVAAASGRPLVAVVRDAHRHAWMADLVRRLAAARTDLVVVETGLPELILGALHVATYGATTVSARAAAEVLLGH